MASVTLREANAVQLFNAIRDENLTTMERIPPATRANLEFTWRELERYRPAYNDFVNALINRIGLTIFSQRKEFTNPLSIFKKPNLAYGSVVQEIATGLLEAHVYDPHDDGETVFSREVPDVKAAYHSINRENFYKVSINRPQLQRAFLSNEPLANLVEQFISVPVTSDNLDEFNSMVNLLDIYDRNGGFYYDAIGNVTPGNEASYGEWARTILRSMRAYAENLSFPSARYNAGAMPTFASVGEFVVFCTPETKAMLDVDALSAAFNIERMDAPQRFITIPKFAWPERLKDVHAILTVDWFFQVYDSLLTTEQIQNPQSLNVNHFLHHWQIISASPFAPAVALTTERQTIIVERDDVTFTLGAMRAVTIYPRLGDTSNPTVARGGTLPLDVEVTYEGDVVPSPRIGWEVRGNTSPRTQVTVLGTLVVASDETSDTVTVRAYELGKETAAATLDVSITGPESSIGPVGKGVDKDGDGDVDFPEDEEPTP